MRRRLLALFLTAALLAGASGALAAGSASDPLVTRSYAENWAKDIVEAAEKKLEEAASGSGAGELLQLAAGSGLKLAEGACVTLVSGSASVRIDSGDFLNVSVGGEAVNGRVNPGQMYIVCEDSSATVTASSASVLLD